MIFFIFQGIPTLIIAVAGIDDALSVAGYGILKSVIFSHDALWYQILQGPIAIVGGFGFGILWGLLAKYVPERNDVSIEKPGYRLHQSKTIFIEILKRSVSYNALSYMDRY